MLKEVVLCGALALVSVPAAMAQVRHGHGHGGHGSMLARADADGDGTVSRDEFRAARTEQFDRRDRNSDGYLDEADRPERMGTRHRDAGGMLKQLDADNDGKISKQEFIDGSMSHFDAADKDGNGVLDANERQSAEAAVRQRMQSLRNKPETAK